jgi:ferredoxin--NADP+ reductase
MHTVEGTIPAGRRSLARRAPRTGAARRAARTLRGLTEDIHDTRVIAPEAERYNATLVRREDDTSELARFWVRADDEAAWFEPGQYMTIGVFADEMLYQRPYSVASAPVARTDEGYEFYVRLVPILRFTTLLWRLPLGHQMRMIGPKGRFMLEPDDDRTHLFVSTGTGIAPFIAMCRQLMHQGLPRRTVMLNACSYQDELGYRDLLEGWHRDGTYPVTYVPTISRPSEPRNAGWEGYTGRAEAVVADVCRNLGLSADSTVVYLCGNPDMIINAEAVLMDLAFPEAHVKKELYWPKGKKPAA